MTPNRKFYIILFTMVFVAIEGQAQVVVDVKNAIEKIKNGHTHVLGMSNEMAEVFKKYWTLSQGVDSDYPEQPVAGDTYFNLETKAFTVNSSTFVYHYFNLWTPANRSLLNGRKNTLPLAGVKLSVHGDIGKRIPIMGGQLNHWAPGFLKNYLQQLSSALQTGKTFVSDNITNREQLKSLKKHTLYFSEDDFYTMTTFGTIGEYSDNEIEGLFKNYKFEHKVLSSKELSDKIMADTEPFYYLLYIPGNGKMIVVINSRTGELIYARTERSFSNNLKEGDIKDLYKQINK
ncbi:hypothetical protein BH09BAC6_BH09BAC6_11300 [soil metagenome]